MVYKCSDLISLKATFVSHFNDNRDLKEKVDGSPIDSTEGVVWAASNLKDVSARGHCCIASEYLPLHSL
jgi:hypothetical protein